MNEAEPFSTESIEHHLHRSGIQYLRDQEGRFLAIYGPAPDRAADLQVWYSAEGPMQEIYAIRVTTSRYYPADQRAALLEVLNKWNCEMRWPEVHLAPTAEPSLAQVVAEGQLDLTYGLHQAGFDRLSLTTIAMAETFYNWLEAEFASDGAADVNLTQLEDWLRDAS